MFVRQKMFGRILSQADMPAGGTLFTALEVYDARMLVVAQSTPGQTISLPAMYGVVNSSNAHQVKVRNTGTASFVLHGVRVLPGTIADVLWHGVAWAPVATPSPSSNVYLSSPLPGRLSNSIQGVLEEINIELQNNTQQISDVGASDFVADLAL